MVELPAELRRFAKRDEASTLRIPSQALDWWQWVSVPFALLLYVVAGYPIVGAISGEVPVDALTVVFAPMVLVLATVIAVSCAFNAWGYEELRLGGDLLTRIRGLGPWQVRQLVPRPDSWECTYRPAIINDGLPSQVGPWLELRVISAKDGSRPRSIGIGKGLKLDRSTLEALGRVLESWAGGGSVGACRP